MSTTATPSPELSQLFDRLDTLPTMYDVSLAVPMTHVYYRGTPEQHRDYVIAEKPQNKALDRPDFHVTEAAFFPDGAKLAVTGLFDVVKKHVDPVRYEVHRGKPSDAFGGPRYPGDEYFELLTYPRDRPVDFLSAEFNEPYILGLDLPKMGALVSRHESPEKDNTRYRISSRLGGLSIWASPDGEFLSVRTVAEAEPGLMFDTLLGYLGEPSNTLERAWALDILLGMDPQSPSTTFSKSRDFTLYQNSQTKPIPWVGVHPGVV